MFSIVSAKVFAENKIFLSPCTRKDGRRRRRRRGWDGEGGAGRGWAGAIFVNILCMLRAAAMEPVESAPA